MSALGVMERLFYHCLFWGGFYVTFTDRGVILVHFGKCVACFSIMLIFPSFLFAWLIGFLFTTLCCCWKKDVSFFSVIIFTFTHNLHDISSNKKKRNGFFFTFLFFLPGMIHPTSQSWRPHPIHFLLMMRMKSRTTSRMKLTMTPLRRPRLPRLTAELSLSVNQLSPQL